MKTVVAARIKNSRIQKGYSLQEVAEKIGVSKQMINKYEQGIPCLPVKNSSLFQNCLVKR